MSSFHPTIDDHHLVSPMTITPTTRSQSVFLSNRDETAPEAVESSYARATSPDKMSPATAVAGPYDSPDAYYSPPEAQLKDYRALSGDSEKEVICYDTTDKIPVMAENRYASYPQAVSDLHDKPADSGVANGHQIDAANSIASQKEPRKIFGMKRTLFYVMLALICIIIAVAVGAGVGATVSKNSKSGDDTPAQLPKSETSGPSRDSSSAAVSETSSPSLTIPASSGSSASSTASAPSSASSAPSKPSSSAEPTFLNETSIISGYGFQGYSRTDYQSLYTEIIMEEGSTESGADFDFAVNSYQWIARITNCCVSFCKNATDEGWIGYQCTTKDKPATSEGFTRVWVWCEDDHLLPNARGRCSARRS